MSERAAPNRRSDYRHFLTLQTRWMDNDVYGHVNNVVYYSFFDTVVNEYLIRAGVLDIARGATIGLVVETRCNYFSELSFPQTIVGGLRVARIGTSSVRYEIGFLPTSATTPALRGTSFMSTSTAQQGVPRRCRRRFARRSSGSMCERQRCARVTHGDGRESDAHRRFVRSIG